MDQVLKARQRAIHGAEGVADEAGWLRARLRAGQLDRRRVEVAGALGYAPAGLALDQDFGPPLGSLERDLRFLERIVGAEFAHAVEWGADAHRSSLAELALSARLYAGGEGMAGLPRRLELMEYQLRVDPPELRTSRHGLLYEAVRHFAEALREPEASPRAEALSAARRALAEVRVDALAPEATLRRARWTLGRELLGQLEDPTPYSSPGFLAAAYAFAQSPAEHYARLVDLGRRGGWRYRRRSWSEWQAALRDSRGARSELASALLRELFDHATPLDRAVVAVLTLSCLVEPGRLGSPGSRSAVNRIAAVQLALLEGSSGSPYERKGFWAWLSDDFEELFGRAGPDELYDALARGMDLESRLEEPGVCSEVSSGCTRGRRAIQRRVAGGSERLLALQAKLAWTCSRDPSVLPLLRRLLVSADPRERRIALEGLSKDQLGQHLPQVVRSLRLEVDAQDGGAALLVLQLLRQRCARVAQRWWLELRREIERLRPGELRRLCKEEFDRLEVSA